MSPLVSAQSCLVLGAVLAVAVRADVLDFDGDAVAPAPPQKPVVIETPIRLIPSLIRTQGGTTLTDAAYRRRMMGLFTIMLNNKDATEQFTRIGCRKCFGVGCSHL